MGGAFLGQNSGGDLRRGANVSERVFASKILAVGRGAFTLMCTCVHPCVKDACTCAFCVFLCSGVPVNVHASVHMVPQRHCT